MDLASILALVALVLAVAALAWAAWNQRKVLTLGLGLGTQAGPLVERLGAVGRQLDALQSSGAELGKALGQTGLRPAMVHYAPLGLGGAHNCFVLALLNREGDGVLLNYLSGTAVRLEAKEVRGWESAGMALTAEEEQAVGACRRAWEG